MRLIARLNDNERLVDLCREFGISRKTGYKIVKRYKDQGVAGLEDQSRAPRRIPHRTPDAVVELVIGLRRKQPTWGPRKLRVVLRKKHPDVHIPAESTIAEILERHQLITKRRKPRGDSWPYPHLSEPREANDLWCIDYKGQFRMGNGKYCYPLTITDAASRFILACEGFERIHTDDARVVLEDVFKTHGVPKAIRFDGGAPFASTGLARLSKLSVWWLSLGITLEQIEPSSPQQNGRHERMHRTLKAETTRPAASTLLQQQDRFDRFVETFNTERPHEAIEMKSPREVYASSTKKLSDVVVPSYPLHDLVLPVSGSGRIRFPQGRRGDPSFSLTSSLAGQPVGLRELEDERWLVTFCHLDLGHVERRTRRFVPLSPMSPDRSVTCVPG